MIMATTITYPVNGRGAWPTTGAGGTLSANGTIAGRYYRNKAVGTTVLRVGRAGYFADRDSTEVSVDHYATFAATRSTQRLWNMADADGIWGPKTDVFCKSFQTAQGLYADGVFGPATARKLYELLVKPACDAADVDSTDDLQALVSGHITYESGWDAGAVGRMDSTDCGIAQLHLSAHPAVTIDQAFDPAFMVPWMAKFVNGNLVAMDHNVRDAVAAYNLGVGGARQWVAAGRPDIYTPPGASTSRNMKIYIDRVLGIA